MIVVSGGGSFLGMNVAKQLAKRGERVVITTRRRNDAMSVRVAADSDGLVTVEVLDLTNMYEIVNLFSRYEVRRVIHTATAHMYANTRSANWPSYQMLFNMLEAATSAGVERFVLANSIVVYRGVQGPFREDQNLPPLNDFKTNTPLDLVPPYEVTLKRVMEAVALDYGVPMKVWDKAPALGTQARTSQMQTIVLRFPAQCGPLYTSMYNPVANLVHAYVKKAPEMMKGRELRAFVDLSYGVDSGDAMATVALAPELPHRIYNVSSGFPFTGRELLETLYAVAPDARDILKLDPAAQAHDPGAQEYLDIDRIRKDLGWTSKFTLESMLTDYIDWVSKNGF